MKDIPLKIRGEADVAVASAWIRVRITQNNFLMDEAEDDETIRLDERWSLREHEEEVIIGMHGRSEHDDSEDPSDVYDTDEQGEDKYDRIMKIVF